MAGEHRDLGHRRGRFVALLRLRCRYEIHLPTSARSLFSQTSHNTTVQISRSCQCILASATQSPDLNAIVKLVMENPQRIDLLGAEQLSTLGGKIEHSYLKCPPEEKALHVYALIQFHSIDVPIMIFVNSIHEGYRLHLFLDCFRIASSLLHRELPQDTRQRLIEVGR